MAAIMKRLLQPAWQCRLTPDQAQAVLGGQPMPALPSLQPAVISGQASRCVSALLRLLARGLKVALGLSACFVLAFITVVSHAWMLFPCHGCATN